MTAFYREHCRRLLVFSCLLLLLPFAAQAAWWEFGRSAGEPYFSMLRFNNVDAEQRDDMLVLTRDDLIAGSVVVRGRAEVGRGEVGLVEISLDSGKTWSGATLGERGMFTYEFAPQLDREYPFRIRAISTTGVATGPEEHDFKLLVSSADGAREARAAFMKLLDAYQREDRASFMRGVSENFEGNLGALEDGLAKDFRYLDDIRIQATVSRINRQERTYEIYFTYNRQVRSAKTGNLLKDSAASIVGFRLESGGMKLVRMSAPLIFGVSEAEDVATSVTGQSVGQQVLTISNSGEASTAPQGQNAASSQLGLASLRSTAVNNRESFEFDTEDKITENTQNITGDIAWNFFPAMPFENGLALKSGTKYKMMSGPLSALKGVQSATPFAAPAFFSIQVKVNDVIALQLSTGKYAAIEVLAVPTLAAPYFTFRYKYQPNGSPNF